MLTRLFHWPVGASVFAGMLGAGVVDAAFTLAAQPEARVAEVAAFAFGFYGVAGLVAAGILGTLAAIAIGAVPGGARAIANDERLDLQIAAAILAGTCGAAALAAGVAAAHGLLVAGMENRRLQTIATGGIALGLCAPSVLVALACRGAARALASRLPRPGRLARTGFLLLLLAGCGAVLGALALSRADWRVLDLGPVWGALVAAALGTAHGLFWYASARGRRLHARLPVRALRVATAAFALGLLTLAARVPAGSPAYEAISDGSLGLRFGLRLARGTNDRDGDGFSAAFGGGDCADHRRDTYPGAEDIPGDGIDQNCQGGDAARVAPARVEAARPSAFPPFRGNILIVTIDALRADRLGVAGYGRPAGRSLTPTLDALAGRGAYFRRVWAQAPNTPRSFPSFLTSRYPSEIAWQQRSLNYSAILPANETFFEPLAKAGWKVIGIFSHFYFAPERGLGQGFAEWSNEGAGTISESNQDIASPRIVPQVIARIERAAASGERFVLWTHLFEPHSSYLPHDAFPTGEKGVAGLEEKYDYEIAFTDAWVGKIVAALQKSGLDRTTAVVVLADHGEAWGEHKRYFHGQDLTEEQLRVPLIVVVPGRRAVVIDHEVALVDVGPTLLDLVGLPPAPSFRGRSLLPAIDGQDLPPRPVFAELLPATAWPKHEVMMVAEGRKLTHRITDRRFDLHDLAADPWQQENLAGDPASRATLDALRAKLLTFEEGRSP